MPAPETVLQFFVVVEWGEYTVPRATHYFWELEYIILSSRPSFNRVCTHGPK
jgi:hypothetical protein